MRDFEIKCVEMKTVSWNSGWHRYALRCDHVAEEGMTELLVDDIVLLQLTQVELLRLREALEALEDDAPPVQAMPRIAFPPKPQKAKPLNTGKPWAPEDDELLASRFRDGETAKQLAEAFGRSAAAVQLRLVKLGLVEAAPDSWRGQA